MADEWFKCWHEMRRDEKLLEIAEDMDLPLATVIGYWTCLLCLAHELDEEWHLRLTGGRPLRIDRIARAIHTDSETATRFLAECQEMHMVVTLNGSPMIANGRLRNLKPSDSKSARRERQQRSRQAKKAAVDELSHPEKRDMSHPGVTPQRRREESKTMSQKESKRPVDKSHKNDEPVRLSDVLPDLQGYPHE
jgi:hypothetical protein